MARHEEDREDLYAEFRSAVQKWEFSAPGFEETLVAGIRRDGRFSIYFNQDHCYHFNAQQQLMRAYVSGSLYRSQGVTLARLTRQRTPEATNLLRYDLSEQELSTFLQTLEASIQKLLAILEQNEFSLLRSEPDDPSLNCLFERVEKLSQAHVDLAPSFPTKRK